MPTLAKSSAGTSLSISASLPASEVIGSYTALSYTVIAEVTSISELGKVYNKITHNPLNDRKTYKLKGSYDQGVLAVELAKAISNAGQTLLLAASNSDSDYTFKITYQDLTADYFTGKAMDFKTKIGGVDSILGASTNVELTSDIFTA